MSKGLETVWALEPHTAKKHEILRHYFQAWLPILGHTHARLLYIDAFAGPGEYTGGEDGSPVVILTAARDHVLKLKSELLCLFVESEEDRYQHLMGYRSIRIPHAVYERVIARLVVGTSLVPICSRTAYPARR